MRLLFGEFCFDTDRRELSQNGSPVHVTPKALQLLQLLIESRPKVLNKEDIYRQLWPETFVEESSLPVLVSTLREALNDQAKTPRFLKTAHGFGYGFIAEVREESARSATSAVRLRGGKRDYDLADGENIIGRDPNARVYLNAPGISRHHARITISRGQVTIEDLGSKNGTWVQGKRIEGSRELNDGDEIRLSRELLVLLKLDSLRSTLTDLDIA